MPDPLCAVYQLEIRATFTGLLPRLGESVMAIAPTEALAVETVRDLLVKSGFTIASMGYGSRRLDKNGELL